MKKPVIVYVSGAPGSGKSTLAKLLSEQLYTPLVASDLVHGGVAFTQPEHDRKQTLLDIFVPLMVEMAQKGISFVADHVLQKGISETSIIGKLRAHANIVYVHTKTEDPIKRYIARVKNSDVPSVVERRESLLALAPAHQQNLLRTSEPLDLGIPTIVVRTDDGYEPALNDIVAFIEANRG